MSLIQDDVCTQCGNTLRANAKFCDRCGTPQSQPNPNRIVWNIFSAWKAREHSVWNVVYAQPFESAVDLLKVIGNHVSTERLTVYCGSYVASQDGQMTIEVLSWHPIHFNGSLGDDEGHKTISLTNLESC